ncbi:MAG TPA: RNA-binding protein [Cytophagales bacterium]|jgi:RNA recognition motif-containing protein|nr:RNA-binding protein [Cytophagales bacterium]
MNIFVANLNFKVTNDSLKELFESYGEVSSAKVVMDKASGRSKGFGFVEMPNDSEAKTAVAQLNNKEEFGRALVVKEALPRD